jgi:hypothetical protein
MIQPNSYNLSSLGALVDTIVVPSTLSKVLKRTFADQLEHLKALKKNAPDCKKNSYSITIYNKALCKIVELIGECVWVLHDPSIETDRKLKNRSYIQQLNMYYEKYMTKYCRTPRDMTVKQMLENEIYSFLSSAILSPDQIKLKKTQADSGYSMMNEMKKYLEENISTHTRLFSTMIASGVDDFLKWAESHPRSASYLMSDMSLTCSILLEKDAADKMLISINAMVFTKLFLDALGLCAQHEEVEQKKLLKFRVLTDLIYYCPTLATAYTLTKKTVNGEYKSFLEWSASVIKEVTVNYVAQKITRMIPEGQEKLAGLIVSIIRGRDLQEIIAHQRNLCLIQLAGGIRALLKNPYPFLLHAEVWVRTAFESTPKQFRSRIFVQIIMPILTITLLVTSILLMMHVAMAVILSLFLLASSLFLKESLDELEGSITKNTLTKEIEEREKKSELLRASYFIATNEKLTQEITLEAKIYIFELQQKYALPVIPTDFNKNLKLLKDNEKTILNSLRIKILHNLRMEYLLRNCNEAPDVTTLFNDVVDLKKIRESLKIQDEAARDLIIYNLTHELITKWLEPHIVQSFKIQFLKLYHNKKKYRQEHSKYDTSPDEYLKTSFKRELKLSNDNYDEKNKKFIFNSLRKRKILE